MAGSRTVRHRLWDMLDAMRLVRNAVKDVPFEDYRGNPENHAAVERCIEIRSEASRHIPVDFKARFPEIPWRQVADPGNFLRHAYDQVQPARTWALVVHDVEPVRRAVEARYASVREPKEPSPL